MKLIIAYIQPDKLSTIKEILYENKIHRFSISEAFGHSEEPGFFEKYRGIELEIDMLKKTRIEIAVNDSFCEIVIDSLIKGSKSGELGDGKIFVLPLEQVYRIRTGESGSEAIG